MSALKPMVAAMACVFAGSGCSVLPDLPDHGLPVREILLNSACELRTAFRTLTKTEFARFKARQWLIQVTLTPKVDTDLAGGGGWTGKNTSVASPPFLSTWVIGGAPGVQLEAKGQRIGAVTYSIKSQKLIDDQSLRCDIPTQSYHELSQHLGVGEWLHRTAAAMSVASMADVDKPTYTTDIIIKFAGNGSYTYAFPFGSQIATLSGSYQIDEQLQIYMTILPDQPKEFQVITLPVGENFKEKTAVAVRPSVVMGVEDAAKTRLDLIQLEQTIRGLQNRP